MENVFPFWSRFVHVCLLSKFRRNADMSKKIIFFAKILKKVNMLLYTYVPTQRYIEITQDPLLLSVSQGIFWLFSERYQVGPLLIFSISLYLPYVIDTAFY